MSANDVDQVLALEQTVSEAPHWNRAAYEGCIASEGSGPLVRAGFVAEVQGQLVGFLVGKLVAGTCELESIAVAQEVRREGIGRALVKAFIDWAKFHGARRLELEVRASNARAVKLYEGAGLRREGLRAGYYQSPEEDALLMGVEFADGGKLL